MAADDVVTAPPMRSAVRPDAVLLVALVGAIVVALNLRGLPGSFLADDIAHLVTIATLDRDGRLASWLAERFVDSLHNGNFAYRPILFLSYALDWRLFGATAAAAHVENLLLHLADSALVGVVAYRWSRDRSWTAGAFAAAAFAAYPFAGEVSFWVVGRANLLAALFALLLLGSLAARGASASRHVARIVYLLAALLSNESAMPLALIATIVVVGAQSERDERVDRRFTDALRELWPLWAAFGVYLAWRKWLFGAAISVYPTMPNPSSAADVLDRFDSLAEMFGRQSALQPPALWPLIAFALLCALALGAWRARRRDAVSTAGLAFAVAALVYVAGAALAIPPARNGEGARNYYLPWICVACAIGLAAERSRATKAIAVVIVGWFLLAQDGSLRQWQRAATSMRAVTTAVPRLAQTIDSRKYAALLLPDRIDVALFARTAQGGIVMWPVQRVDYLQRMAGMTERDIDTWRELLATNGLAPLHGQPLAIQDFVGVFCFRDDDSGFVHIAPGGALPSADWARMLRAAAEANGCLHGTFNFPLNP